MGNNPSKNDLPNTSSPMSGGPSSGVTAGELETDESAPPLSRPTGNGRQNLYHGSSNHSVQDNTLSTRSSPQTIPASKGSIRKGRRSSQPREADYDFDIDASMAILLSGQCDAAAPKKWRDTQFETEYGSSTDSLGSAELSISPVFTSSGENREESSLLSESLMDSPVHLKGGVFATSLETSLDPIVEVSTESTPEPRKAAASSKTSARKRDKSFSTKEMPIPKTEVKDAWAQQKTKKQYSQSPPLIPVTKSLDIDLDKIIDRLLAVGMKKESSGSSKSRKLKDKLVLTSQEIKYILAKSRSVFMQQPTLLKLAPSVKIVGDIHGQYHDLIRIFNSCGYPPYSNYLFLGDYVDRGHKSLETILLLLCYKIKYPENFFMLRGNHESANITKIYGFYDECKRRLPLISGSHKLWKNFVDVFNTLPIAATINDKIFCIHGGLSPDLKSMRQIEQIQRPTDIPDKGLLADLLWSDPDPLVRNFSTTNWPKNDRGVSYCFGKKHVDHFLSTFKMDLIVRGHMVVEDGYEFFNKRKLVTVFLAPNYCGEFKNYGAVMNVDRDMCCSFELLKPQ